MKLLLACTLALVTGCAGCKGGDTIPEDWQGVAVAFVEGPSAPPQLDRGTCYIYSPIPPANELNYQINGTRYPTMRHIGQSFLDCVDGKAIEASNTGAARWAATLYLRYSEQKVCGVYAVGCYDLGGNVMTIVRSNYLPSWQPEWAAHDAAVHGHELMHGVLGNFHPNGNAEPLDE